MMAGWFLRPLSRSIPFPCSAQRGASLSFPASLAALIASLAALIASLRAFGRIPARIPAIMQSKSMTDRTPVRPLENLALLLTMSPIGAGLATTDISPTNLWVAVRPVLFVPSFERWKTDFNSVRSDSMQMAGPAPKSFRTPESFPLVSQIVE